MIKPHVCYLRQMPPNGLLELVLKRFIILRDRLAQMPFWITQSSIILMFKFLLLHSGDIQVNPGPPKHPCGLCNKAVRTNQKAIKCKECLHWSHINCTAMSTQSYDNFRRDSNLVWICNFCVFPDFFTTFLLDNLNSLANNNSYQSLEFNNSTMGSALNRSLSPPLAQPLDTSSLISHTLKQKRKKLKVISLNCKDLKNPASLRSKRFQSSYCAKVRSEAKKRLKGEGRRGNTCSVQRKSCPTARG